jgi:alpha-galactosidase
MHLLRLSLLQSPLTLLAKGPVLLCLLLLSLDVFGASIDFDAGKHVWSLKSGAVEYRLKQEKGVVVLAYFGPAGQGDWSGPAGRPIGRFEIGGMVDGQRLMPGDLTLLSHEVRQAQSDCPQLRLVYKHKRLPLEIEALYTAWGDTGVFTRRLNFTNRGELPLPLEAVPSLAWCLPHGSYTLEYLYGGWGEELQLTSEKLGPGRKAFVTTNGRSSNGTAAWFALKNEALGVRFAAQLAYSGNWEMSFERHRGRGVTPGENFDLRAELGMRFDFGGAAPLAPGATFAVPEVAFTAAAGDLDDVCNQLHRYQRRYVVPHTPINDPLLTSFSTWQVLLRGGTAEQVKQLADGAAELGLEALVIDASWFGDKRNKATQATRMYGDWEADPVTFPKGLRDVADYVHAKGMKFGVWLEPECACPEARVLQEHPDWLLRYNGKPLSGSRGRVYLDFGKPEVGRWLKGVVDRLVQQDGVDWLKLDYNMDVGQCFDPAGAGRSGTVLYEHLHHYFAILDEIRADHPKLVLENCASGGLRFDLASIHHTHVTWTSDEVEPRSTAQLVYGSTLEFAPELGLHWAVGDAPKGPRPGEAAWGSFDLSNPPGWWDFIFRIAMNGQFGVSSRVNEWNAELKQHAKDNIALYKRLRPLIMTADVYHLTPPPKAGREPVGWLALQYAAADRQRSVLMAYRLGQSGPQQTFHLRGLDPALSYKVSEAGQARGVFTGRQLAAEGLPVTLEPEWRSAVIELEAQH